MATVSDVNRLASFAAFTSLPESELEWLAAHGSVRRIAPGDVLYGANGEGEDLRAVFVVLSGRFSVRVNQDGVEREVREVNAGEISGTLPYSRLKTPIAYLVADGPVEIFLVPETDLREMIRECHDFTSAGVHAMIDRARAFKRDDLHREKLAALGRLAAGLAHELNNPASAMARSATQLEASRADVVATSRALGAMGLSDRESAAIRVLIAALDRRRSEAVSPLAQLDHEESLKEWLAERGLDADAAHGLAGTGLTIADLEAASASLDARALDAAVRFAAAEADAHQLTRAVVSAASRIHSLVAAVKTHTHMDRAAAPEPLVLEVHLADTLALLHEKARAKAVSVELTVEPRLPRVQGIAVELNHAWFNLIDNAIDAAPPSGRVTVSAGTDRGGVVISIVDDGPGINEVDLVRIFDPFYTTKDPGQGTGLGLDVVRTTVESHGGTITAVSRPGRTEFRVVLPPVLARRNA